MPVKLYIAPAALAALQLSACYRHAHLALFFPHQVQAIIGIRRTAEAQQRNCGGSHLPRPAVHCRHCGKCVQNFDHHCIWLNCCICQENYNQFVWLAVLFYLECFTGTLLAKGAFQPFDWVFVAGFIYLTVILALHLQKPKSQS